MEVPEDPLPEDPMPLPDDSHLSLAIRRVHRIIRHPNKYLDDLPETPVSLQPIPSILIPDAVAEEAEPLSSSGPATRLRRILKSPRNIFGLFRQYFAVKFPSHDPEVDLTVEDLSDVIVDRNDVEIVPSNTTSTSGTHGPYPNGSSFALGEWFWNTGAQKSKSDFKHLVGIITDPAFRTDDIRDTQWDKINRELGTSGSELDWFDEPDAGWTRTPVTI